MSEFLQAPESGPSPGKSWVTTVGAVLKVGLVVAGIYLGIIYYDRWSRPPLERDRPPERKIPADYYVYSPKSLVTDVESARSKLVGKPLWVKEGYRWSLSPGGEVLLPLEKIVPTGVVAEGQDALLEFERGGSSVRLPISIGGRYLVDDIFLLKDPRELYSHWPDEVWGKIERHEVEAGMTEHQVAFSIGAGSVVRGSPGQSVRIVEYTLCAAAGLPPVRVTFRDGVAEKIVKMPPQAGQQK